MKFFRPRRHPRSTDAGAFESKVVPKDGTPLQLVKTASLEQVLARDRLIRGLIRERIVSLPEVYTAWAHQQDFGDTRQLWRVLADVMGTDSTMIFRYVAGHYSFTEASVSQVGTQVLVAQNRRMFTHRQWRRMVELGIFPIREKNDPRDGAVIRWTFAAFDPSLPTVRSFVEAAAPGKAVLRFAPPYVIFELIGRCTRFQKLAALPWYQKYVLGRLSIPLRTDTGKARRIRAA